MIRLVLVLDHALHHRNYGRGLTSDEDSRSVANDVRHPGIVHAILRF